MYSKLRWVRQSEKMSLQTGEELETRERKLWTGKSGGEVELREE